ncbi:uncharacterized protein Z518_03371 [Rhinocladiella mackenziei CBS 650.93]|uniref:Major facilitator superfamily (MFS) profile domain-containing protein n=1 Tax=Rhinocladiella mackenziei CBS 650.93 TaxID=1442369 RepID=A0A0D2IRU5_9EURO|nr:uncharacterized protein Z518_03371 [Rhinocladiella mackenziei CBS 650.93]KIX08714.1 hypothetical protein Z518_03371 [Rhinocladiella mackenziei CBS 650.93]
MVDEAIGRKSDDIDAPRGVTLGTVQLRHETTNEILLVPKPSDDPDDPLNWPLREKHYIFVLSCFSIFVCNACGAGPSAGAVAMTTHFFAPPSDPNFLTYVGKVAYFFTGTSLTIGIGQFIWTPVAIKYGRRPVYIICFALLTACNVWAGFAKSYGSELAARLLTGIAAGAPELVAPLTLTDIFFLHQRGKIMAVYNCSLALGSSLGVVIFGLVIRTQEWRVIFWILTALSAFCMLIMIFTIPETAYNRSTANLGAIPVAVASGDVDADAVSQKFDKSSEHVSVVFPTTLGKRTPYFKRLSIIPKAYTSEGIWLLMFRPVALLALPGVLWATLINSVTVGMIVVLSSNFSAAFQTIYGFTSWQAGLTFIAMAIGSLVAIFFAGHFSDWIADRFTQRNGGVRIPEMRLPALSLSVITGPLGCILYGVGFGLKLHWMCPVVGIALIGFTVVQSMVVSLVYILDSYRPVSGEVIVTQSTFKACFGFLLGFYTNPWVQQDGYLGAFGAMGGIEGAILLGFVPFYFWGSYWRRMSWNWPFIRRIVHWADDREVGE